MTTIYRSDDLTVPPLVGCYLWNRCSLSCYMLFVSYVWVLCSVVGVWGVVIFVLSVMRVVGGVPLWVEYVFHRVDVCHQ